MKTLEGLLNKGKVGLNIAEAGADYRITPWFIANGSDLYGKNGEEINGSTLNNSAGLNVLKWVAESKNNSHLVAVNADEISALKEGRISALFSGVWNVTNVEEVLGEHMGTVVYPTANFGNGSVNLKAFSGIQLFVVNSASKNPSKAMDLAKFVTTKEAQLKMFKEENTIPANKEARATSEIQNNPTAKTIVEMTTEERSVLMPKLPEMKNFWPNMNAILVDAYRGKIKVNQLQGKLDQLTKDMSSPLEE